MIAPDLPFWTHLLGRLAVEAGCVVSAALLLDRLVRPAFWRRALWQGAVVCLLVLTASELSGFGRGLASFLFGHARPEPRFVVWTTPVESRPLPAPEAPPTLSFTPIPVAAPATSVKPEIIRPVWWPGLLWLAGGLVILGRVAAAQILFISLRRRRPDFNHPDLNARVAAILQRLAVRRKIRLLQSPGLTGPIAFGVLRPSVGLPLDFAAKFTRAEQDAMLAHELAHLASHDPLWYLLADFGSAALWWHPQSWWARRRLHRASELAADEAAAIFPEGPAALAGCLVTLGREMTQNHGAVGMGVEGGGFRSNLAERVQRLLRLADHAPQPSHGWPAHAARLAAITTIAAGAIALSGCLQSRNAEKQPTLPGNLSQSWANSPASTIWHSALPPEKAGPPSAPKLVKVKLAKQAESAAVATTEATTPPAPKPAIDPPSNPELAPLQTRMFHGEPFSLLQGLQKVFPSFDGNWTRTNANSQDNIFMGRYFASLGINLTNDGAFSLYNSYTGDILLRAPQKELDSAAIAISALANSSSPERVMAITSDGTIDATTIRALEMRRIDALVDYNDHSNTLANLRKLGTNIFLSEALTNALRGQQDPELLLRFSRPTQAQDASKAYAAKIDAIMNGLAGLVAHDKAILDTIVVEEEKAKRQAIARPGNTPPQPVPPSGSSLPDRRPETNQLYTRTFHVDPIAFQGWDGAGSASIAASPQTLIPLFFRNVGVDLRTNNGKFVFFNDRRGDLLVRATALELDTVTQVLELLNKTPPQVVIAVKFATLPSADYKSLGLDSPAINTTSDTSLYEIVGTLHDQKFRESMNAIDQFKGSDVLTASRVVTMSRRQAHFSITTNFPSPPASVAAGAEHHGAIPIPNAANPSAPSISPLLAGANLDVFPTISADGFSIQLEIIPTQTAFWDSEHLGKLLPQPHTANVWDGQTLVVRKIPRANTAGQKQELLIFITPTIVDPAGNRLHTAEQMPPATNSLPRQTDVKDMVAAAVQEGKLLYETGRYDEAEVKLKEAMQMNPSNPAALYYMDLIKEARLSAPNHSPPAYQYARTNLVYTSSERQAIMRKLRSITLPEMDYPGLDQGLPLPELMKALQSDSKKQDVDQKGILFLYNPHAGVAAAGGAAAAAAGSTAVYPKDITIKITPPTPNLTLFQALDIICKVAKMPAGSASNVLSYAIEDYAVMFFVKPPESPPLFTRTFHVDPKTFIQALGGAPPQPFAGQTNATVNNGTIGFSGQGGGATGVPANNAHPIVNAAGGLGLQYLTRLTEPSTNRNLVLTYFRSLGVDLETNNGRFVFFNDRTGDLLIRATEQDLDTAARALELLNQTPPQVRIDVKFASVTQPKTNAVGFSWFLGNATNLVGVIGAPSGAAPAFQAPSNLANPSGMFPKNNAAGFSTGTMVPATQDEAPSTGLRNTSVNLPTAVSNAPGMVGILNNPQFRMAINALDQQDGTDLLSAPRVTTLSGRQAHVAVQDIVDIVTTASGSSTASPGSDTNAFTAGPSVDVLPTVSANGNSIQLAVIASSTEFLGYDMPVTPRLLPTGVTTNIPWPLPHYRVRQTVNSINVWDGQTIVLGGDKIASSTNQQQNLLIFITARIIDPAGNPVHTDDEIKAFQNTILSQAPGTGVTK
jgi:type II secretory pathway component GspD/PulD (secretin)/beta-lactamase regulating signal transducer with metallopeptidase domain